MKGGTTRPAEKKIDIEDLVWTGLQAPGSARDRDRDY